MSFQKQYTEIKDFLSISEAEFKLEQLINKNFQTEQQAELIEKVLTFIYYFTPFKMNRAFMSSVHKCIAKTLDIKITEINDFDELLIKNSMLRFVQEYIDYAKIGQKEQVLNFLADSFERLGVQPLILNLGLLLKPMYSDQNYIDKVSKMEEIEVIYELNDDVALEIKQAIDKWLGTQSLDLDKQDELTEKITEEYDNLISEHNLSKDSQQYRLLLNEVIEMLSMKLTMLSLMESIDDESMEPIPL
jgi:hypothetical protein